MLCTLEERDTPHRYFHISKHSMRRDHTFALSEKENNLLISVSVLHAFHSPKCNQACITYKVHPASPKNSCHEHSLALCRSLMECKVLGTSRI